jgi:antitoxin (DNA-binding transcriptional repressor) of toxin-antitoxin stability system
MVKMTMQQISISKFKATCLAVLEHVRQTREPVLVTRRGVVVAEIKPPPATEGAAWIGSMAGTLEVVGDIVSAPAEPEDAWEALRK